MLTSTLPIIIQNDRRGDVGIAPYKGDFVQNVG